MNNAKQKEFVEKYNALCEEYGMQIIPQMQLTIAEKPLEAPKEETPE